MDLHGQIMNLRSNATPEGRFCARSDQYNEGHRAARHAAAELAARADAELLHLRTALEQIQAGINADARSVVIAREALKVRHLVSG